MMRSVAAIVAGVALLAGCTTPSSETSTPASQSAATTTPAGSTRRAPAPDSSIAPRAAVSFDDLAGRAAHTATALLNGDVLVAGGCIVDGCSVATAETFIVASDCESVMRGPDLLGARDGHTANRLLDGSVALIAGYAGEGQAPLASVEIYAPAAGVVRSLDDLEQRRGGHASAALSGDRVVVLGGWVARRTFTASVEIIDVASGSVTPAAPLPVPIHAMDAVTLQDGRVLVTGGQIEAGEGTARAWTYDPESNAWSETGSMLNRRFKHFSVLLPDGRALVIGGTPDDEEILATTEIYDAKLGTFMAGPDLVEPRYKLPGGAVLVDQQRIFVGGGGRSIEIIDLDSGRSSVVEDLGSQGSFATTTALGDETVLILGGYDRRIDLRREVRVLAV